MNNTVPLCHTRIWCRANQSWLSFKTTRHDRFLVSPEGYFIELPDGSMTRISPRMAFPLVNHLPSIVLSGLSVREQFGKDAVFLSVPLRSGDRQKPTMIPAEDILKNPLGELRPEKPLQQLEEFLLMRMLENGVLTVDALAPIVQQRDQQRKTIGEILVNTDVCHWETLLAQGLDIRPPSRLDPPSLRTIIERREWELTGEILYALDKVNRTELEHALKIKREATQALGQILTAMGACSDADIEHCLNVQEHMKQADTEGVVLIGKLLVTTGVISDTELEEVLWKQRVSRQPLEQILVQMSACTQKDID
jgi:hypothetical protein